MHPVDQMRNRSKSKKWLGSASKAMDEKGTKGSFTSFAKGKGEGVQQAASENYNAPGVTGKRARFAFMAGHNWQGK